MKSKGHIRELFILLQVDSSEISIGYQVKIQAGNSEGEGPFSPVEVVHTAELGK